jgi:hypothetical protein
MRRHALLAAILSSALAAGAIACGSGSAPVDGGTGAAATIARAPVDAGRPDSGLPQPSGPPKRIFTKRFVVNVRVRPDRESTRIGYLRAGAVLSAKTAGPVSYQGCRGGWFELTTGGFVCNGSDVIAFDGRRMPERRPAQPTLEEPLPYRYARTRREGAPMYRRLPSDEEAAVYEGFRIPGYEVVQLPDGGLMRVEAAPEPDPAPAEASAPSEAIPPSEAQPAVAREATASGEAGAAAEGGGPAEGGGAEGEGEVEPVITLGELEGERASVLMRRLVKGFIVSLDRDMRTGSRRYWRTLSNGFIPYGTQVEVRGSELRGHALDGIDWALPIGWVLSNKTISYTRGRDGRPRRGRAPGYHHSFRVVGEETHRDRAYVAAADGALYERDDVTIIEAHEPPPEIGPEDRWLEVDLEHQSLVAYEGRTPVYATLVSTGRVRDPEDPLRDMRTPTGLFRITSKHVTHTMDGDHAVDGPYSIEDVPYVMYFQLAYALHSAFWHDGFGRPRSHGCVNLAPQDARWVFDWAGPPLPEAWHGIYPTTEEQPGTWIWIHGETPEG